MGAKLGRRFLKQPAEKLKAVFVAVVCKLMSCFAPGSHKTKNASY